MRTRYHPVQRAIHWLMALVVIPALLGGAVLGILGFQGVLDAFGQAATNAIYTYHKTFGVLALILIVLRIAARRRWGAPAPDPSLSRMERVASGAVHAGLYAGMAAMPLLGWAATASGGFPVQFFDATLPGLLPKNEALGRTLFAIHGYVGMATAGLLVLHIGGAWRHWRVKRDGVMRRMALI